jgi:hypothetical protein
VNRLSWHASKPAACLLERAAPAFLGRWRIVASDLWDPEDLDSVVPAHITFGRDRLGELELLAIGPYIDYRTGKRDGSPIVEFTWEGSDVASVIDAAERERLGRTERALTLMSQFSPIVEAGGLMLYGADLNDLFRRAAGYVDKILKGTAPAALPIEQPSKYWLVVNLKTAKALGLVIPQSLRLRADQILE